MSDDPKVLPVLTPPAGGWHRLLARRAGAGLRPLDWWPLVSAGVAATVLIALTMRPTEIRMPLTGDRLMGVRSQGIGIRMLDGRDTTQLPSSDPAVQMYWVEPGQQASARPQAGAGSVDEPR